MSYLLMLFVVSIFGALIGIKKPWMGGVAGLVFAPLPFLFSTPLNTVALAVSALIFIALSAAYGLLSFMVISGLKGGGHNIGQTCISGFGAHHPGGIILTDEELKMLKDRNIKPVRILSY